MLTGRALSPSTEVKKGGLTVEKLLMNPNPTRVMYVIDPNVFPARRILTKRREFVLKAKYCTTTSVERKMSAQTQLMRDNLPRICTPGALIIATHI